MYILDEEKDPPGPVYGFPSLSGEVFEDAKQLIRLLLKTDPQS